PRVGLSRARMHGVCGELIAAADDFYMMLDARGVGVLARFQLREGIGGAAGDQRAGRAPDAGILDAYVFATPVQHFLEHNRIADVEIDARRLHAENADAMIAHSPSEPTIDSVRLGAHGGPAWQ